MKNHKSDYSLVIVFALAVLFLTSIIIAGEEKLPSEAVDDTRYIYVMMRTSLGKIVLELDTAKAPITCANFLQYAKNGFYDSTIFHRVIGNFMIQGGGFTADIWLKRKLSTPLKMNGRTD